MKLKIYPKYERGNTEKDIRIKKLIAYFNLKERSVNGYYWANIKDSDMKYIDMAIRDKLIELR